MQMVLSQKRIYFISLGYIVLLLMLAVFPFSAAGLQEVNNIYLVSFRLDHLIHVAAFLPLYPLSWLLIRPRGLFPHLVLLVICLETAILAELVQYWLHYRSFNPADMIANAIGTGLGFLVFFSLKR
jgi:glycopeptide antibiotics resistance protein